MHAVEQIIAALAAAHLEAVFIDRGAIAVRCEPVDALDLLVRDTPLHRARIHEVARALAAARVPLSDTARAIQLVGAALPIHIVFGQTSAETYAQVRARAREVHAGAHVVWVA